MIHRSSKFMRSEKAQIITLAGVIIALTVVLLAIVINTAAISGQKAITQEVDDAHYVFKNVRDVYGDVLRQASNNGVTDPFKNDSLESAEVDMTKMCNAHGYSLIFTDKSYDGVNALVKIIFSDGETMYRDTVKYKLRAFAPGMHLYDFSTGAGIDKWAYEKSNEASNPPSTGPDIVDEYEFTNYTEIATPDDVHYSTNIRSGGGNRYATHHFNFSIDENPVVITNLYVEWEGYGTRSTSYLYIWNVSTSTWERIGSGLKRDEDNIISKNFVTDFENYIDGSGFLHVVAVTQRTGGGGKGGTILYTDYVKVEVTYSQ